MFIGDERIKRDNLRIKMLYFSPPPILIMALLLYSCDNNITLSKSSSRYNASVHLQRISEKEELPEGVRSMLAGKRGEDNVKFPLPYYLIPQEQATYMRSQSFDVRILDQIIMTVSGIKYHKMFIHPESEANYEFLSRAYRYLDANETEFMASVGTQERTLVVWNKNHLDRKAFIISFDSEKEKMQLIGLVLKLKDEKVMGDRKIQAVRAIANDPQAEQILERSIINQDARIKSR